MRDCIQHYSKKHTAHTYALNKAEDVLLKYDKDITYDDINVIIDFFNIQSYFDNKVYSPTWDSQTISKYISIVKSFKKSIGIFCSTINEDNFMDIYNQVDLYYRDDFWELIESNKVYKRITAQKFKDIITAIPFVLRTILKRGKLVLEFDKEISSVLNSVEYTELILGYYLKPRNNEEEKLFKPQSFTTDMLVDLLKKYISWEQASPNYLHLIATAKPSKEYPVSDRIRYSAHKKYVEFWSSNRDTSPNTTTGITVGVNALFYDDSVEEKQPAVKSEDNIITYNFGTTWFNDNLDYPTLLNNLIYIFGFTDLQCRYNFLSNPSRLSILESVFSLQIENHYNTGIDYRIKSMSSDLFINHYSSFLHSKGIELESLFKWFFEDYLKNEFNVNDFSYISPSPNSSKYEKILVLVTQLESIIKQYRLYLEDGYIDRDFFEFSSTPYRISETPSAIPNKYIYVKDCRFRNALNALFSENAMYKTDRILTEKYDNLLSFVNNENVSVTDFYEFYHGVIDSLLNIGFLFVDSNNFLKVDNDKAFLLTDLYTNGVLCKSYYHGNKERIIDDWISAHYLEMESSLFTRQEQEYIDYMLNIQKYHNGPELRNKYAHGTFPLDMGKQHTDYLSLLKLTVLIIIKINEEFCLTNPIEYGIS